MPGEKVQAVDSRFREVDMEDVNGDSHTPRDFTEKKERDVENPEAGSPPGLTVSVTDEATLFASPLPITGERKTTTRKELWVGLAGRFGEMLQDC